MENEEDINNRFRTLYKDYIDEFYDDDVLGLLQLFRQYNKLNDFKNRKYYGKYLIKRRREW